MTKRYLDCIFTTAQETTRYEKIVSVTLPALFGEMQFLPGAGEAFSLLQAGNVILQRVGMSSLSISISDGACHMCNDRIVVFYKE